MSPAAITLIILAVLYVLGRYVEHNVNHTPDDDVAMDTWAWCWEAAYADDELERLWNLPTRGHSA